ncbi:glycosyl hydrolase [Streptomyces sp. NRRL F-2890]|uniref:glycosyl hydrolase n=1 Tax=Streptomyces sp. NRRL F-2890 TaxID=1463845 RepID=UPI0004C56BAB|nr:glycosyl hydrolase [Streptomyces sp. NRRL F-2890]
MTVLFRDPVHDGATDPTLIRHRDTGAWWMFYTARRAGHDGAGVEWVHGTDIGIAVSTDDGAHWEYRGIARGLEYEAGRNTYWAPEVLWHDGTYHMYVTYLTGIRADWSGPRHILHYTSADLEHWNFVSRLELSSEKVIDACVWPLPPEAGGGWRMWFKDEADGSTIHAADSPDLFSWRPIGRALEGDQAHEGPTVLAHAGSYWMLTDCWDGLLVYRSTDLTHWERQPGAVLAGESPAHHAVAIGQGDDAGLLVYFTQPEPDSAPRRSQVEALPLAVVDGALTPLVSGTLPPLRADLTVPLRGGTAH